MKQITGLVIAPRGIEDVAAKEVEEILKAKPRIEQMAVVFEAKDLLELCRLCYISQSAARVVLLLDEFSISKDFDDTCRIIGEHLKTVNLGDWITKDTRFKVECRREGEHGFKSQAIAEWLGGRVFDKMKQEKGFELSASLKDPNIVLYVFIVDDKLYMGIDLAGFDVSKRDYKIMSHMPSIKGNIGYALLRLAGFERKSALLDVSSYSGVVPIEAALFATDRPVNYFRKNELHFTKFPALEGTDFDKFFEAIDSKIKDKPNKELMCINNQLKYISAAKSNSKIAGVNKSVEFSRFDVEWLDTKFPKGSVEIMASNSHRISRINEAGMVKYYNELFYQANYILKKTGRIGLLTNNLEVVKAAAEKNHFKAVDERTVWQGDEVLRIGVFVKAE
jgi:23S rRNA G2445 N2-methylase RlmL